VFSCSMEGVKYGAGKGGDLGVGEHWDGFDVQGEAEWGFGVDVGGGDCAGVGGVAVSAGVGVSDDASRD